MAERAVGHGSFGVVFQVCCSLAYKLLISSNIILPGDVFLHFYGWEKKQDILSMLFCRQNAWKPVKPLR